MTFQLLDNLVLFRGIKMELPDELANAKRWHDTVNSRPSAKA